MSKCSVCRFNGDLEILINLGKQPYANKYPVSDSDAENIEILEVLMCPECRHTSLGYLSDRKEMFVEYFYLSSVNQGLVRHFAKMADAFSHSDFVLDIGSNDGILLRQLVDRKIDCLGIEPSENVGGLANKQGLTTWIEFFDRSTVEKLSKLKRKPSVIVVSSVFTHVEHPRDFLLNCREALSDEGRLIIEVESLLNILKNFEFERFYFDRPNYYSSKSIELLAEECGFKLVNKNAYPIHGIVNRYEFVKKDNNGTEVNVNLSEEMLYFSSFNAREWNTQVRAYGDELVDFIRSCSQEGYDVVGFGCPARFSTITNYLDIDGTKLKFVVDDSPLKQGKLSPGTHVPIVGRESLNSLDKAVVLVFAYEYLDDFKHLLQKLRLESYKPIPLRKLL